MNDRDETVEQRLNREAREHVEEWARAPRNRWRVLCEYITALGSDINGSLDELAALFGGDHPRSDAEAGALAAEDSLRGAAWRLHYSIRANDFLTMVLCAGELAKRL